MSNTFVIKGEEPPTLPEPLSFEDSAKHLHALTLIRLRWFAIVAQSLTGLIASQLLDLPVRIVDFGLVVCAEILFNLIARIKIRSGEPTTSRWLMGSVTFDLFALTGLLFVSGGAFNPFTTLYIIQIAIAAMMLPPKKSAMVVAISSVAFALLFSSPTTVLGLPQNDGSVTQPTQFDTFHLAGMWVAYVVAAISVASFTGKLVGELRVRQIEVRNSAVAAERARRLASLAGLATGAAHEIATPLSTIAVVASELEDLASDLDGGDDIVSDAQLIRQEVARCRAILDSMAVEAGYVRGDSVIARSVEAFLADALARVHEPQRVQLRTHGSTDVASHQLGGGLAHALAAVINNATQADPQQPIEVDVHHRDTMLSISVRDHGPGMPPEVIAHATEPFFTTRDAGRGMGLGLFLAYNVSTTLGGSLDLHSVPNEGTTVTFKIPLERPPMLAHE